MPPSSFPALALLTVPRELDLNITSGFHPHLSAQPNPPGVTKPTTSRKAARGAPGDTEGRWGLSTAPRAAFRGIARQHLQSLLGHQPKHRCDASPNAPDPYKITVELGIFWY